MHTFSRAHRERAETSHRVLNLTTGISGSYPIRSPGPTSSIPHSHPRTRDTVTHSRSPPRRGSNSQSPADGGHTHTESPPMGVSVTVTSRWRSHTVTPRRGSHPLTASCTVTPVRLPRLGRPAGAPQAEDPLKLPWRSPGRPALAAQAWRGGCSARPGRGPGAHLAVAGGGGGGAGRGRALQGHQGHGCGAARGRRRNLGLETPPPPPPPPPPGPGPGRSRSRSRAAGPSRAEPGRARPSLSASVAAPNPRPLPPAPARAGPERGQGQRPGRGARARRGIPRAAAGGPGWPVTSPARPTRAPGPRARPSSLRSGGAPGGKQVHPPEASPLRRREN